MDTPLELFRRVAIEEPDLPFIKAGACFQLTYQQAWRRIRQIAHSISKHVLVHQHCHHQETVATRPQHDAESSVIALHVTAEADFVLAVYAAWLAGRSVCVLNKDWAAETRQALVQRLGINLILYSLLGKPQELPGVQALDMKLLSDELHDDAITAVPLYAWITHTSGTTGLPKSTMIQMKTIAKGAPLSIPAFALKPYVVRDLASAPTFLYATSTVSNAPYVKSTLLVPPPEAAALNVPPSEGYIKSLDNGARNLHITPSILTLVRDHVQHRTWNHVDVVTLAGEMITPSAIFTAKQMFPNATIRAKWSQTELMWVSFVAEFPPGAEIHNDTVIEYAPVPGLIQDIILLDEHGMELEKKVGTTAILAVVAPGLTASGYLGGSVAESFRRTRDGRPMLVLHDWVEYRPNGRLVPKGRSNRKIKLNGLYVDLDYLDQLLKAQLSHLISDALVMKSASNFLVLLYTQHNGRRDSSSGCSDITTTDVDTSIIGSAGPEKDPAQTYMDVLELARRVIAEAGVTNAYLHFAKALDSFPMTVSYKRHLARLQEIADQVASENTELGTAIDPHDFVSQDISRFCATLCNTPHLAGKDFDLLSAGFDSLTVMRLVFHLRKNHQYRTDAVLLLKKGTRPTTIANAIRNSNSCLDTRDHGVVLTGQTYEVSKTALRSVAVYMDEELPYPGFGIIRNHYRRRITYEFNIQFIYRFQPHKGRPLDIPRLDKAVERLCERHPILRSRVLFRDEFRLPQVFARNFGYMSNHAVVQAKGHKILIVKERDMYDHVHLQRILKHDLSRLNTMVVMVAAPGVSFAFLAMCHMIFDLESHRVYKDHLSMLYECPDRQDIPTYRILTAKVMTEESLRRLPRLPSDIKIFKIAGFCPPIITVNYFQIDALHVNHPERVFGAFVSALLYVLRPASNMPMSETVGYCGVIGIILPEYTGNGLAETYDVLSLPLRDHITLEEALYAFQTRKTFFVTDRNIEKFRSHIFVNVRTHEGGQHPRDQHIRDISKASWPSSQGQFWVHFDIYPTEGRISGTFMKSTWIKKEVKTTMVARYLDLLESWNIRAEAVVAEGLPIS
ncbi:hypothetical protein SeMB42_g02130 [Synchytrium endobioticum]|uniref:AMP-dependent synthetase/ligase domain-containing protein n=1 Tax=Synchytrium endobioticum TaxID=286115 RepID=A0A507DGK8_9FUNG|nr:hypothetical protein SeLEV6574_g01696 [Synchytrium endobioticum]TPX50819.1 hypothetical protein SeMB42_g02130 [Synchytrium endobioticum]